MVVHIPLPVLSMTEGAVPLIVGSGGGGLIGRLLGDLNGGDRPKTQSQRKSNQSRPHQWLHQRTLPLAHDPTNPCLL
jgi:hypothetical protein